MRLWLLGLLACLTSLQAYGHTDLRHMRGAHATSNYGANVAGFAKTVFGNPSTITADGASISASRSVSAYGTWDLATVTLTGVRVGNSPKLATAGFWLSSNPNTGEISLAFNPSMDASLAPVAGFSGDVNLPRSADGSRIDLTQISRASGVAREFVIAVAAHASTLAGTATFQATSDAGLGRAAVLQALDAVKASIALQEGARARYFAFLRSENVEWIAVTIPIYTDSLADPTVRLKYRPSVDAGGGPYTFEDEDLQDFILDAKRNGFKMTLAFEFYPVIMEISPSSPGCGTAQYKPNRWLLGQPTVNPALPDQACINPADWWWAPSHPQYAANVATFWNSYTQIAAKYAAMAQQTGLDMFILSTEQDNLFRTRAAAAPYTNHFRTELTAMVNAVRAVYSGPVTYEQHWWAFAHPDWMGNGGGTSDAFAHTFIDLGLDAIAVSAYFNLTQTTPTTVLSVADFEAGWESAFSQHLVPLQARHPGKRMFFSEWGYTNDVGSPNVQASQLDAPMQPGAAGNDGITQQRNIIEAFFNVNRRHNDLVAGGFHWGLGFPNEADCGKVTFGVYCKPASAQALAEGYATWLKADVDRVFDWAQNAYPQFFPTAETTGSALGYLYRYYPATGTYLGVKDGRVWVHNGREWNFVDVGEFRTFLDAVSLWGY